MSSKEHEGAKSEEFHVLPGHMGGGPHGLGDPDDFTLRRVETEIIIPKMLREEARKVKCAESVKVFSECSKDTGLMMPFKCRKESAAMKSCFAEWFTNKEYFEEMKKKYLAERAEYRRTGVSQKQKRKDTITH